MIDKIVEKIEKLLTKIPAEIGKWVRKILFTLAGTVIIKLSEMGLIDDLIIEQVILFLTSSIVILITGMWTDHIKPWILSYKKTI